MRGRLICGVVALALAVCGGVRAAEAAESAAYTADLADYAYPFPVRRHALPGQGQPLEMAYMDLHPAVSERSTVVLLHGKNFSGAYWEATARALAARGHRVVIPDQIGFGKSDKPTGFQYSFHALASHTASLLDALGVGRVVLVGHSMGGMLAVRFATMYPGRVQGVALVNPIGLEDWSRVVPYRPVAEWERAALAATPESVKAYMQRVYFGGKWRPEYDALVEIQAGWIRGPDRERIARVSALTSDMIYTQPVVHEFPDVRAPVLLIIGQRDRTALGRDAVSAEVARTLGDYPRLGRAAAERFPRARLVELEDVGHVPQVEAFDLYLAALAAFVADPDAAVPAR